MRVLLSWLGRDDVLEAEKEIPKGLPTLTPMLRGATVPADRVVLLNNLGAASGARYRDWVRSSCPVDLFEAPLKSPVDYREIHAQAVAAIESVRAQHGSAVELVFFLNSGTPPMGSMWLLLGKGRYRARFMAWSGFEKRLQEVDVPFEINADFIPSLLEKTDTALRQASAEKAPIQAAFSKVAHRCRAMQELLDRAQRVAVHNVPVLIEGETGTGKELLAAAIHGASPRRKKPFIAVNCGAIPEGLVESELFGSGKGAFTNAENRDGKFRAADGGTLFLDEIGELPLAAQVKLLRPLETGEMQPVGAATTVNVDVRVIAATHRDVAAAVGHGAFREDLFYRLAVAVLKVPPLREREGDLPLLVDRLLEQINEQNAEVNLGPRTLSAEARNRLRQHTWPGNVRELASTLRRAIVWSSKPALTARDIEEALLRRPAAGNRGELMARALGEGFDLNALLEEVQDSYIERAMVLANGKKVDAARLLGLKSHQVLTNRMRKPRRAGSTP